MSEKDTKAVVILSGGMDSTTLLYDIVSKYGNKNVYALSFDYNQKHRKELANACKTCIKLDVYHKILNLDILNDIAPSALTRSDVEVPEGHYADENMKLTVVPNRNMVMLSLATSFAISQKATELYYGAHSGDHCFSKNTKILTIDGLKTINDLKIGQQLYSFNKDKKIWEKDEIIDIIPKNSVKTIKKIHTRAGEIELTEEHKVYKLKLGNFNSAYGYDKSIEIVPVKDLKVGDYLIQPTNLIQEDKPLNNISLFEIAKEIIKKYKDVTVVREGDKFGIPTGKTSDLYLPIDTNLNDFVSVMAWYIAEGCSSKTGYELRQDGGSRFGATFYQSVKKNLDKVEYIIKKLKNSKIPVRYNFSKTMYNGLPKEVAFCFSNVMSIFMKECGSHSQVKNIPDWLWEILISSQELREEFIRSITLGDGHNYNEQVKGYSTKSPKLYEQMTTLLQLSGYHYSLARTKQLLVTSYLNYSRSGTKQAMVSLGDAKFTEIVKIEDIDYNDQVFDISVKNNHNFVAGNYGQHLISNSIYPDCRPEFIKAMQHAIGVCDWSNVSLLAPYSNFDKGDIAIRGKELGVDFSLTWTCYKGKELACGKCGSCAERLEAFQKAGIPDPIQYDKN